MKRLGVSLLALLALLVAATAAFAGPRDPQERLTAADNALAKRGLVKLDWLAPGWTRTAPSDDDDDDESCPGYDPDFSSFTLTGNAVSAFKHRSGATMESEVEVYPSRAQAAANFRLGAKPALAKCLRDFFLAGVRAEGGEATATARMLVAPRIGERAVRYQLVAKVKLDDGSTVPVYIDFVGFQKGRSQGFLFVMSFVKPVTGQLLLVRAMANQLR